jgi:hypothetical protein
MRGQLLALSAEYAGGSNGLRAIQKEAASFAEILRPGVVHSTVPGLS